MQRRDLSLIFYAIFLLMFVTTFVVAIGGILHWWPFDRIDDQYTSKLFYILVAEIALIGVDLFRRMPRPFPTTILRYELTVKYENYFDALKKALTREDKQVWERYLSGQIGSNPSRKEQALISELRTSELNQGETSRGEAYLNFDNNSRWLEGSLTYRFPRDQSLTHIGVVGKLDDDRTMTLDLAQPERFFWDNETVRIRTAANYTIKLIRDEKDRGLLRGTLTYQYISVSTKPPIEIAKVTLVERI